MNTRIVVAFATVAFLAGVGYSTWAQATPQGTGVAGPRTTNRTTAVDTGVITTRMGQGLHTTLLEQDGELIDRVSTVLGVTEGGFVASGSRTNGVAGVRSGTTATTPPQPAVRSGNTTTNAAPQSRGTGIRPEGSATPYGRQAVPRPPESRR